MFFWVADDADQGFSQRIFYIHVPVALTSYVFFGVGAFYAARYLLRRDEADDLDRTSRIHVGIIFGTLVLLTGPIWAKISWGHWWNWSDEQLNVFLILFLFYSAYFMLRFSLDPGPRRSDLLRCVRAARHRPRSALHPRRAHRHLAHPPDRLHQPTARRWTARCSSPSSCGLGRDARARRRRCSSSRCAGKRLDLRLRAPARAAGGLTCRLRTSPSATAVKYVAAAYAVVWLLVLLYVWILRAKYRRLEGEVADARASAGQRSQRGRRRARDGSRSREARRRSASRTTSPGSTCADASR